MLELILGKLERKNSLYTLYLIEMTQLNHLEYIYLEHHEKSLKYYVRSLLDALESLPALKRLHIGRRRFLMIKIKLLEKKYNYM